MTETSFSESHHFEKPNDTRALDLMDTAARHVMSQVPDIILGFGESDEYSFLIHKSSTLYNRRQAKIVTLVVSMFTSAYVYHWRDLFGPKVELQYPPVFDGRVVLYPGTQEVVDYFKWRGVDSESYFGFQTMHGSRGQHVLSQPISTTSTIRRFGRSFNKVVKPRRKLTRPWLYVVCEFQPSSQYRALKMIRSCEMPGHTIQTEERNLV